MMAYSGRKVTENFAKIWKDNVNKEQQLRLSWFKKNEERLMADANAPLTRSVGPDVKKDEIETYKLLFQEAQHHPKIKTSDPPPLDYDPDCLVLPMRSVPYETRQLLYSIGENSGRVAYLKERKRIIPENKYYFPETTNFRYGWKMWNHAKSGEGGPRFGRSLIIKHTFYRRRGVDKDAEWYKDPVRLNPSVCDCR